LTELALIFSPLQHKAAQKTISHQTPPAITATVGSKNLGHVFFSQPLLLKTQLDPSKRNKEEMIAVHF